MPWAGSKSLGFQAGDQTPPSVPNSLSANAVSSSEIDLTWAASTDAGSGVAGYRIYRNGGSTPIAFTASIFYNDTGLTASTTYTYQVSAVDNATNESGKSTQAQATTAAAGTSEAADFAKRAGGVSVIWAHNFASASEVNQFRYLNGQGQDPAGAFSQDTTWDPADGYGGGGALVITVRSNIGDADSSWWRPFGALGAGQPGPSGGVGNGLTTPDPAANGTVRRHATAWNSSDTTAAYRWQTDMYGNPADMAANPYWNEGGANGTAPTSGPTNVWEGQDFWLQFDCKVSASRWTLGNVSGKLAFINTMGLTGTQEILLRSIAPGDPGNSPLNFSTTQGFVMYTSQGKEGNSVVLQNFQGIDYPAGKVIEGGPTSPFTATCTIGNEHNPGACWEFPANQWFTLLIHVVPGRNNDTFSGNGNLATWPNHDMLIEAWKWQTGDTDYVSIFQNDALAWDYWTSPQSGGSGQTHYTAGDTGVTTYLAPGFNGWQPSGYMNANQQPASPVGFQQRFRSNILSKDYIPPPTQTAGAWFLSQSDSSWTAIAAAANQQPGNVQQTPYSVWGGQNGFSSYTCAYVDQRRAEYGCAAGGGHGDGADNATFGLYLRDANPAWRRMTDRTPDTVLTFADCNVPADSRKFLDGRPRAMHNINMVWGDDRVWFPMMDSVTGGQGGQTDAVLSFDRYKLGTARSSLAYTGANIGPWTFWGVTNANSNFFGFGGGVFDRYGHQIIGVANGSGGFGISWQIIPTRGPNIGVSTAFLDQSIFMEPYWAVCAYDLRIVVIFDGFNNRVAWLDLNPANAATYNKWTVAPTTGPQYNPTAGGSAFSQGIAGCNGSGNYIARNRCIAVVDPISLNGQIYKLQIPTKLDTYGRVIFDPNATWTWSILSGAAGTPPTGAAAFGGGNTFPSRCKIVEDMGNGQSALVMTGNYNTPTYVYKIPAAGL